MEEMQKNLTDSSLLSEKSFGLLFQLNQYVLLLFDEEAVCFFVGGF